MHSVGGRWRGDFLRLRLLRKSRRIEIDPNCLHLQCVRHGDIFCTHKTEHPYPFCAYFRTALCMGNTKQHATRHRPSFCMAQHEGGGVGVKISQCSVTKVFVYTEEERESTANSCVDPLSVLFTLCSRWVACVIIVQMFRTCHTLHLAVFSCETSLNRHSNRSFACPMQKSVHNCSVLRI